MGARLFLLVLGVQPLAQPAARVLVHGAIQSRDQTSVSRFSIRAAETWEFRGVPGTHPILFGTTIAIGLWAAKGRSANVTSFIFVLIH